MATSAEVPMDESTLVATSMEVQMKAIVATTTEVQMDGSPLITARCNISRGAYGRIIACGNSSGGANATDRANHRTEVPIVTTRPMNHLRPSATPSYRTRRTQQQQRQRQ